MAALRKIWAGWLMISQIIGNFIGRVILTIFYFTIFMPFGLFMRARLDPLQRKRATGGSHWRAHPPLKSDLSELRRQF